MQPFLGAIGEVKYDQPKNDCVGGQTPKWCKINLQKYRTSQSVGEVEFHPVAEIVMPTISLLSKKPFGFFKSFRIEQT